MNFTKNLFLLWLFLPFSIMGAKNQDNPICIKGDFSNPACVTNNKYNLNKASNPLSQVKLISPYQTLSLGVKKIPVGLWVQLKRGWHSYWHYPGESGKALKVSWHLPKGALMSSFKWPLPERIKFGSLTTLGYKNSFLLISQLSLNQTDIKQAGATPRTKSNSLVKSQKVKAKVKWLICKKVCVPIEQTIDISWPVEKQAKINISHQALFDKYTQLQAHKTTKILLLNQEGQYWKAHFFTNKALKLVDVLPFAKEPLSLHPPILASKKEGLEHSFYILPNQVKKTSQTGFEKGVAFADFSSLKGDVKPKKVNKTIISQPKNKILAIFKNQDNKKMGFIYSFVSPKNQGFKKSIFWFLLFAFIGGLLLNLMPCVLPIVFLKFSNTVKQVGKNKNAIVLENICYSVGVIFAFLFLALWVFLLKKGGEAIGWGFHLQSPYVLLSLIFLFTLISLSFMGWLSLPALPFFHQEKQQGYFKHFLTGVLSTASASPCTAPFMGASVGYGLAGSELDLILIFLFLGLGLSFPYLLLSVFPTWIKYVPLPGKWTQKLKHFMAFPMLGTALWLITVLNQQKTDYLLVVLFCLLFLIFAVWLLNQLSSRFKILAWGIFILTLAWPFWHVYQGADTSQIKWATFSLKKMEQARKENQALFVNITANWCLTCKFNERVTFQNKKVIKFFKDKNILALKGDWTKPNKEITHLLELYERAGIPFYLYIPANKTSQPVLNVDSSKKKARLLPALLTPTLFFKYTKKDIPPL